MQSAISLRTEDIAPLSLACQRMSPSSPSRVFAERARARRRRTLERFARDECRVPGGDHPTARCDYCSQIVIARFGGDIRGYWHDDNPTACAGETEGGHDFALLPDGFIVDPWLYHYYGEAPVLDLTIAKEIAAALDRYRLAVSFILVSCHVPPVAPPFPCLPAYSVRS